MGTAEEISRAAVDMETGLRGFLLAGKEEFLEPYRSGENAVYGEIATLQETVSDNPPQVERLARAEGILRQWQRQISEPAIELRRQVGAGMSMDDIANMVAQTKGKQYFDKFRVVMSEFRAEEERLLNERQEENATTINMTYSIVGISIIGGVIGGVVLAFWIGSLIANPIDAMAASFRALAEGNKDIEIPSTERRDEIGVMAKAANSFKEALNEMEEVAWVRSNVASISVEIQQAKTTEEVSGIAIRRIARLLECGYGIFFVVDEASEALIPEGSYATRGERLSVGPVAMGEGLVGQCARERKEISLKEIPEAYLQVRSGTGHAAPTKITMLPVTHLDSPLGVVELAHFKEFTEVQKNLLRELTPALAIILLTHHRS